MWQTSSFITCFGSNKLQHKRPSRYNAGPSREKVPKKKRRNRLRHIKELFTFNLLLFSPDGLYAILQITEQVSASGHLHLLFPLPGEFFPHVGRWLVSLHSILLKHHVIKDSFSNSVMQKGTYLPVSLHLLY